MPVDQQAHWCVLQSCLELAGPAPNREHAVQCGDGPGQRMLGYAVLGLATHPPHGSNLIVFKKKDSFNPKEDWLVQGSEEEEVAVAFLWWAWVGAGAHTPVVCHPFTAARLCIRTFRTRRTKPSLGFGAGALPCVICGSQSVLSQAVHVARVVGPCPVRYWLVGHVAGWAVHWQALVVPPHAPVRH